MESDDQVALDEDQSSRTPAGKGSVRARRREETRERLLNAASDLFSRSGFDETTYDDIARAADVSRQTVFNHFPRKDDFAFEWGIRNRRLLRDIVATADFRAESATGQLVTIMRMMANIYDRSATQARTLLRAWVKAGGPIREDPQGLSSLFEQIIRAGQQSHEFRQDISAVKSSELLRAAYLDTLYQWVAANGREDAPDLFTAMTERLELVLTGLSVSPAIKLRTEP